ncbi:MAG: hypothetical protein ACTTKH_05915 [Treponema sp.]
MEVLHSTDVIGEEIKEEARKKAECILKNADIEIEALRKSLTEKLATLEKEQKEIYSNKIEKYNESVFISLPLRKWKKKMEYVENVLNEMLEAYFTSLDIDKKLKIIRNMLEKFHFILDNKTITIKYAGFNKSEVEPLISSIFSNSNIQEYKEASYSEKRFSGVYTGLIIEDIDNTFICKAGIEQAKENVFDEKKQELVKALFGESLS